MFAQHDGRKARAEILHAAGARGFSTPSLPLSLHDLFARYEHVLVQTKGEPPELPGARTVVLAGADGAGAAESFGGALVLRAWRPARDRLGPDAAGVVPVPELTDDEQDAVHDGALPPTGAAGRALGWVARDVAGLGVGLALGAGSLRVFAHVGIVRALTRAGVPIDYVAGTSAGAIVAGFYALGMTPDQMLATLETGSRHVFRPIIPYKSFLSSRGVARFMANIGRGRAIEDLPVPLAIVGADLISGREVVFRRGNLALAVLASVSIPAIYPAQAVGPYAVVDGGVLNPVPASVVAEMGAGRVIAIKLGTPAVPVDADAVAVRGSRPSPTAVAAVMRALELMQNTISVETSAPTVFVEPVFEELPGAKLRQFREGRRYVEAGEAAVEAALPRLAAALPWLRS
jgi:NTE family protein